MSSHRNGIQRPARRLLAGYLLVLVAGACSGGETTDPGTDTPARLVLDQAPPASARSGVAMDPAPVVSLHSASGDPVARKGILVTVSVASGGGTLGGTTQVRTDDAGKAAFTGLSLRGPTGTRNLRFAASGLSPVTTGAIDLAAGLPAALEPAAGAGQTAPAGSTLPVAPAVKVLDDDGNAVAGVAVTFRVSAGGGTLADSIATTGPDGVARAGAWTLGATPGPNGVTVELAGLRGSPVAFSATGTIGPPAASSLVEGDNQSALVGTAVTTRPAVRVVDAAGNRVSGVRVTFTVASGGGTVTGGTPVTDTAGVARVGSWILGDEPGQNTLSAAVAGVSPVIVKATGTPMPILVVSGDNQNGFVGDSLTRPIVVRVVGAKGKVRPGVTVTFSPSAGGAFSPATATTDSFGLASATWQLGPGEGTQTVTLSAPGAADSTARAQAVRLVQITAAWRSVCGLTTEGTAWCWGSNFLSQLGDSSVAATRTNPVRVVGGHVFAELASGGSGNFHCGITPGEEGWCWGSARHGQLGDGNSPLGGSSSRNYPVPIAGGRNWRDLVPGGDHACGLTTASEAFCWGANNTGAVGNGQNNGADETLPQAVVGGITFRLLSSGGSHTCGLSVSDQVYCWGWQVGFTATLSGDVVAPIPITMPPGVVLASLAAGTSSTCGLTAAGEAWCWGRNDAGQLGDGTNAGSSVPRAVTGGLRFAELSARGATPCGRTSGGQVYCWGENSLGEAGNGATTDLTAPALVAGLGSAGAVTSGGAVGCVLVNGAPRCWGPNDSGQVGDGTRTQRLTPTRVRFP